MILGPESESTFLVLELKSESGIWIPKFSNPSVGVGVAQKTRTLYLWFTAFIGRVLYFHLSIAAYYLLVHF